MARERKKVTPPVQAEPIITEGQYYWCVNCGHYGDYGFVRKNSLKCEICDYNPISLYTLEEINESTADNIYLERFKTKNKAKVEFIVEANKFVVENSSMAKNLLPEKTLAEKLAEIRRL